MGVGGALPPLTSAGPCRQLHKGVNASASATWSFQADILLWPFCPATLGNDLTQRSICLIDLVKAMAPNLTRRNRESWRVVTFNHTGG